jgi:hypothetical protein
LKHEEGIAGHTERIGLMMVMMNQGGRRMNATYVRWTESRSEGAEAEAATLERMERTRSSGSTSRKSGPRASRFRRPPPEQNSAATAGCPDHAADLFLFCPTAASTPALE